MILSEHNQNIIPEQPKEAVQPQPSQTSAPKEVQKPSRPPRNGRCWVAMAAFIVALTAWAVLMVDGYAAAAISVAGIVLSLFGLGANRRAMRNFATTGLIASAVLLIVVAAFLIVIYWGLNSL